MRLKMGPLRAEYLGLAPVERIDFLKWVYKVDPHKFTYATMGENELKFYDGKSREL